mmetsp:Transcript_50202/g.120788  ORF Transcript_50202/g.120788 Transcript_50202/m.120788 type:complete len:159 (-) Transcript_50202:40-516(-)
MKAYMWSPPLLIAWGFGYISHWSMFCCMSLMGLPHFTSVAVEALGGRGSWRLRKGPAKAAAPAAAPADPASKTQVKKQARAEANAEAQGPPEPTFKDAFRIPLSVWLPPIMLVATTSKADEDPLVFCGIASIVFAVIVCGQYVRNRYFGVPKFDLGRN